MQRKIMCRIYKLVVTFLIYTIVVLTITSIRAEEQTDDEIIVVSMGDSYSSGEGIPPFYGQEFEVSERVNNDDWLAHRSTASWAGMLMIPGNKKSLDCYKVNESNSGSCKWYFVASSGAETKHFYKVNQVKEYNKKQGLFVPNIEGSKTLDKQMDIFESIGGTNIDYVTLTIGGNDVDFADIITLCATKSTYLGHNALRDKMDALWETFDSGPGKNINDVYVKICEKAPNAVVLVAGYPRLINSEGGGLINKDEAQIVNDNVTKFNNRLSLMTSKLREQGKAIFFVDVEGAFDGHEAYSKSPSGNDFDGAWINPVVLLAQDQDLDDSSIVSAYSVHPNIYGASAYANCVNKKIQEIENDKKHIIYTPIIPDEEAITAEEIIKEHISLIERDYFFDEVIRLTGTIKKTMTIGSYPNSVMRVEIDFKGKTLYYYCDTEYGGEFKQGKEITVQGTLRNSEGDVEFLNGATFEMESISTTENGLRFGLLGDGSGYCVYAANNFSYYSDTYYNVTDIIIPSTFNGLPVICFSHFDFANVGGDKNAYCDFVKNIYLPDSIKGSLMYGFLADYIGECTNEMISTESYGDFSVFINLESISIPAQLKQFSSQWSLPSGCKIIIRD